MKIFPVTISRMHSDKFVKNECGGATILNLFWTVTCLVLAGLAIDITHVMNVKQRIQVAADSAAHAAALYLPDFDEARAAAITIADATLDPEQFGNTLVESDIEFGVWDTDSFSFTATNDNPDSARVTIRQDGGNSNFVPTYLLKLAGVDYFALTSQAIFVNAQGCLGNALITPGKLDFDFNFSLSEGFCLYASEYKMKDSEKNGQEVKLEIASGSVVAAPDSATLDDLRLKSITTDYVDIEAALLETTYDVPFYDVTNCIIQMFKSPSHAIQPSYITYPTMITITKDMYVMPRMDEDPNSPNDVPGPFENTPNDTSSNAVGDWSAVKALIEQCPTNNLSKESSEGPYKDDMDLDEALVLAALAEVAYAAGETVLEDDPDNYIFVDPNDLVQGAVHYFECPDSSSYVVFDSGVELAKMVLISECGFAFCGPVELENDSNDEKTVNPTLCRVIQTGSNAVQRPYLHDVVLLAEGTHGNTIYARFGLRAGAADDCAPGGGVLMITNGSIRVHGEYDMHDVQAIVPKDVHWHQIVRSWGGLTIAGTKIHAMRNWLSEYVGCDGSADLFLSAGVQNRRLVQ